MWISLHSLSRKKYAIRPFVGGVNGISGETNVGDMTTLMRRMNSLSPSQDYLVTPEQLWLDGIATAPGIVKQFVATQMVQESRQQYQSKHQDRQATVPTGDLAHKTTQIVPTRGASIEWQMTGKDTVGGIQLQMIPQYQIDLMHFSNVENAIEQGGQWLSNDPLSSNFRRYSALETPQSLQLKNGDKIHVKDLRKLLPSRPKKIRDLWHENSLNSTVDIDLEIFYQKLIYVKTLTGETLAYDMSPRQSVLDLKMKIQEKQGIPFDEARLVFKRQQMEDRK